jgi:hypothetical protein
MHGQRKGWKGKERKGRRKYEGRKEWKLILEEFRINKTSQSTNAPEC